MAVTVGAIGSAPSPATAGDKRIDLTIGTVYRYDGTSWVADSRVGDDVLAALLATTSSLSGLSRGVVVIAADQTTPPAGTPAGTIVYKRTS